MSVMIFTAAELTVLSLMLAGLLRKRSQTRPVAARVRTTTVV